MDKEKANTIANAWIKDLDAMSGDERRSKKVFRVNSDAYNILYEAVKNGLVDSPRYTIDAGGKLFLDNISVVNSSAGSE
jgi:hypothetical protein